MKTITQLKDEIKALMKASADIDAQCIAENRGLRPDEKTLKTEILDTVQELNEEVKIREREERMSDLLGQPDAPMTRPKPQDNKSSGIEVRDKDKFKSLGEQLMAVRNAGSPGGYVDPRLTIKAAATGLGESVPSDGGFLVDTEMGGGIMKNVWESNPILSRISKTTLSGNKNGMKFNGIDETSRATGSRYGGITGYWKAEAALKTASKPKFRQIELSLNKLIGLCYATDELLDDATALEQTIREGFSAEFDFLIANAIMNGTGAGQPLGINNSGCVISVTAETGQAANTVVFENVNKMWSRLMASSRPNAIWVCNQDVEPQLHQMSIAVGTGGVPVYMPAGGAAAAPYGTLFGRPVVPIEQCPILGDAGDIMLADFSQYKAIDKGGMQGDVSIHVQFIYDESVFRFVYRFDGQPVLSSAITPFTAGATTATDTLSHFVRIAAR